MGFITDATKHWRLRQGHVQAWVRVQIIDPQHTTATSCKYKVDVSNYYQTEGIVSIMWGWDAYGKKMPSLIPSPRDITISIATNSCFNEAYQPQTMVVTTGMETDRREPFSISYFLCTGNTSVYANDWKPILVPLQTIYVYTSYIEPVNWHNCVFNYFVCPCISA